MWNNSQQIERLRQLQSQAKNDKSSYLHPLMHLWLQSLRQKRGTNNPNKKRTHQIPWIRPNKNPPRPQYRRQVPRLATSPRRQMQQQWTNRHHFYKPSKLRRRPNKPGILHLQRLPAPRLPPTPLVWPPPRKGLLQGLHRRYESEGLLSWVSPVIWSQNSQNSAKCMAIMARWYRWRKGGVVFEGDIWWEIWYNNVYQSWRWLIEVSRNNDEKFWLAQGAVERVDDWVFVVSIGRMG